MSDLDFVESLSRAGIAAGEFEHLHRSHAFSKEITAKAREMLAESLSGFPEDVGIVAFGSLARGELTEASDLDQVAFFDTSKDEAETAIAVADDLRKELEPGTVFKPPGATSLFGVAVPSRELLAAIGLDDDTNARLTRRILLLEESVWLFNEELHKALIADLVQRYLDAKQLGRTQMARFLLNDLVRYWRTLTIDYQAKADTNGAYATRYMKLIVSRKFTFASSILPLFACALEAGRSGDVDIAAQLSEAYRTPSTLRFADSVHKLAELGVGLGDAPSRAIRALDRFVGLVGSTEWRGELDAAAKSGEAQDHKNYSQGRKLARELESALIEIFFASEVSALSKRYLVF